MNDNKLYYFHLLKLGGDELNRNWGVLRGDLERDFGKVIGIFEVNYSLFVKH